MHDYDRHSLVGSLGYWASCAVATYEVACSRKGTSQADLKRFKSIAEGMIADAQRFGPDEEGLKIVKARFEKVNDSSADRVSSVRPKAQR